MRMKKMGMMTMIMMTDSCGPEVIAEMIHPVEKVRKIVKAFRRSPLKNNTLVSYTKTELGKEMTPQLD